MLERNAFAAPQMLVEVNAATKAVDVTAIPGVQAAGVQERSRKQCGAGFVVPKYMLVDADSGQTRRHQNHGDDRRVPGRPSSPSRRVFPYRRWFDWPASNGLEGILGESRRGRQPGRRNRSCKS
jgi:hypothetical protein